MDPRWTPKRALRLAGRILGTLGVFTVLAMGSARAATFVVTKTADTDDGVCDSDCSLREAIIAANANPGADVITLPAGTYVLSIAGINEDNSATGDLDIKDDLTINGAGAATTIVDGGAIDRVFQILGGVTVVINDLTIRNGSTTDQGGGILSGGNLTLNNCIVTANNTTNQGAGIFAASLTLTNTTISNNNSGGGQGAGVFANGALTLTNSTISNNISGGGQGGGIFASAAVTLANSTVSGNNSGGGEGGGIFANAALTLTNSTISKNDSGSGQGGGVFASGMATITGSTITGNQTTDQGGGLFLNDATDITGSVIDSNFSGDEGGGIFVEGAPFGLPAQVVNLTDSAISNNQAISDGEGSGGGIFILSVATVSLTRCTVSGNTSDGEGGGIENAGATLDLTNSTVSGNSAGSGGGGGIFVTGSTTITSSTIASNTAGSGSGGGIEASGATTLANTIIANNGAGGACRGTITDMGNNLQFPGATCGGNIPTADPLLAALANNGGPTLTQALTFGSPAIDAAGGCPPPATDQRGISRPQGAACDIGAFECQSGECGGSGATFLGPTPYLSKADSPFLADFNSGKLYLEDFECGVLTVPGVSPSAGSVLGPSGITDSVDGDDGVIDGSGLNGHSFFSGNGPAGITFTFDARALGGLPTKAGMVWTDGAGTTTFEAFDAGGASLGTVGPVSIADGSFSGTTAEDRFFGVVNAGGISAITLSNSAGGIEVDHLQYGLYTVNNARDLSLTNVDSPDPVGLGGPLTYTLTVTNASASTACQVTVTDTLPAGVTFGSVSGTGWLCAQSAGVVSCGLSSLAPGAAPPITIQVTAPNVAATLTNTATVTSNAFDPVGSNNTATATTTVGSGCPTITLSPSSLPDGSPGTAYSQTITASGGSSPYTFAVTGGFLPPGLTLSASGVVSGTPTASGTFSFTVTATDSRSCAGSAAYSISVAGGCPVIAVSPSILPVAVVGSFYSQALEGSGGTPPYSFKVSGGSLPAGLTLSAAGLLSGTPTTSGATDFSVTATDSSGCVGGRGYFFSVVACKTIVAAPASLPAGQIGAGYNQTITGVGGTPPYQVSLTSGSVPPGLTLKSSGLLSGTPTAAGVFPFTVSVTDAGGCPGTGSYSVSIGAGGLAITSLTPASAITGSDAFTLTVDGGGYLSGAVVDWNGSARPTTFVSSTRLTAAIPASDVAASGAIPITVVNPLGVTSLPASFTVCDLPGAPTGLLVANASNPAALVTGTDPLLLTWQAPATGPAPTGYEFRINGDTPQAVSGTTLTATVPARGSNDPITLFVRALSCVTGSPGPEASTPPGLYSPAAPGTDFAIPDSARVGQPVTFTDTSSPQATSFLWIFDDQDTSTAQSPSHVFTQPGTHKVALIASNGSGSLVKIESVFVAAAEGSVIVRPKATAVFDDTDPDRLRARGVRVSGAGRTWLTMASGSGEDAIVFLRLIDAGGFVRLERRLIVEAGQTAVNDIGAWGVTGTYTVELVTSRRSRLDAKLLGADIVRGSVERPQRPRERTGGVR